MGATQFKEYAESEWYIDIWLTIVWLAYFAVFLGTLIILRERHIFVANWCYLSFIVTVAMLFVGNNQSNPVSFWGVEISTSVRGYAGCGPIRFCGPS